MILAKFAETTEHYYWEGLSTVVHVLGDSVVAYVTGVSSAHFNIVFIKQDVSNLAAVIRQCEDFYASQNLPFSFSIPKVLCTPGVVQEFSSSGYACVEADYPSMGIELNRGRLEFFDSAHKIHSTDHKLSDWMEPLISAFGNSDENSNEFVKTCIKAHERALKKEWGMNHYTLYVHGRPVSSLTLSLHNHLARIDDMGTSPNDQRQGYGYQLMAYALQNASERGASYCFLVSSQTGLRLYESMGFIEIDRHQSYTRFSVA